MDTLALTPGAALLGGRYPGDYYSSFLPYDSDKLYRVMSLEMTQKLQLEQNGLPSVR